MKPTIVTAVFFLALSQAPLPAQWQRIGRLRRAAHLGVTDANADLQAYADANPGLIVQLQADAQLLGSTTAGYDLQVYELTEAAGHPLARYSLQLGSTTVATGYVWTPGHYSVPAQTRTLFPADVSKTYYLTTGFFRVAGNLVATGSMDADFQLTNRFVPEGSFETWLRADLRLASSTTLGVIDADVDYGRCGFSGRVDWVRAPQPGLQFAHEGATVRLRLGRVQLFGPTSYYTVFNKVYGGTIIDPYLAYFVF